MGEGMDGWPLTWKREGRAGWREVVLEIEEKKRGDINLTEGMSLTSSEACPRTDFKRCAAFFSSVLLVGR